MRPLSSFHVAVGTAAILLCSSTIGCGSDSATGGTEANPGELFEPGAYEVGYRELPITYEAAASGDDRELLLRVWYPAAPDSGADPARYQLSNGTINIDLAAGIALDAPPANEEGGFPFAVYSHGNGGEGLLAYPYGELMASHGWIVVGPNHTGNTAFDFLETPDPLTRSALDRPNDITAVIDAFQSGLSGDDLAGKADTSGVFVFGHSFGGYTAFAAGGADVDFDAANEGCEGSMSDDCEVLAEPGVEAAYRAGFGDPRVVALAAQAPALISIADGELAELGIPTMLMTGRLDETTPQETAAEPAWAGIDDPDDLWVEMPLGAHYSFITICYDLDPGVLALFRPDAGQDGCGPEFIDAEEAVPVLSAYVLAFGRRHVLGETEWDAVLTGPSLGNEGDFVVTLP
jgi:predicted dienelactone hydrolase